MLSCDAGVCWGGKMPQLNNRHRARIFCLQIGVNVRPAFRGFPQTERGALLRQPTTGRAKLPLCPYLRTDRCVPFINDSAPESMKFQQSAVPGSPSPPSESRRRGLGRGGFLTQVSDQHLIFLSATKRVERFSPKWISRFEPEPGSRGEDSCSCVSSRIPSP